jgi:hypothetical protein
MKKDVRILRIDLSKKSSSEILDFLNAFLAARYQLIQDGKIVEMRKITHKKSALVQEN